MVGRIVSGPEVGLWVANKIKGTYHAGDNAIGLLKDGKIIAGVLYENYNGRSIVVHIGVEGVLTRSFLGAIFDYPFNVCNVNKLIATITSTNTKSIKLTSHLGFTQEGRLLDATPEGDLIIYTLKKSDCRFLGERYGKKSRPRAAPGT